MAAVTTTKYTRTLVRFGEGTVVPFVFVLFFTSGFAALLYQVIWQRVLAIFSGADVYSVTIIVAAFMAGLGCGSLAGGYIADRSSTRRRIVLFALSEFAIAIFALISKWLYYDVLYLQLNHLARSPIVLAGVLFISLLWPTFFMGMSLPLLARTLTRRVEGAAQMVGSLYAFNTLGAAVGALLTVWLFTRTLGFEVTVQLGAVLNIFAALGALAVAPYFLQQPREVTTDGSYDPAGSEGEHVANEAQQSKMETPLFPVSVWIAIYGVSGFVALSLEILWFRLLGVMVKSTAFTFGNLLAIFLAGLAVGTFWGIKWADRSRHAARIFLGLQAGITLYAAASLALLVASLGNVGITEPLYSYFNEYDAIDISGALASVGSYLSGQYQVNVGPQTSTFVSLYFVLPMLLIGPPTLMMGLSFPFLQKVVQRDVTVLGRRVGWLQTANIFGSMLGAIGTGWLFLSLLGTTSTLKMLLVFAGGFLLLLVYTTYTRAPRVQSSMRAAVGASGVVVAGVLLLMWVVPDSSTLWAKLHGVGPDKIIQAEDGSGLALLKSDEAATVVYANGLGQSTIPFPIHHIEMGMVPVMMHPDPKQVAIIGLGSGATLWAAGGRTETQEIDSIEIVGPQHITLERFNSRQSYGGVESLLEDKRISYNFTDGRAFIMLGDKKYDIIEADALRPMSAYSGNLYSVEYFTLLKNHLKPGGFAVTWAPTRRITNSFLKVFPHAVLYAPHVNILIGSNEPIQADILSMTARLKSDFSRDYYARAGVDIDDYVELFENTKPSIFGPDYNRSNLHDVNTDLFPKDEYLVP